MLQQLLSAALGVALLGSTAGAATAKASGSGGALCQSKSLTTPYARRGKAPGFEALTLCSKCVLRNVAPWARRICVPAAGTNQQHGVRCVGWLSVCAALQTQLPVQHVLRPLADGRRARGPLPSDARRRRVGRVRGGVAVGAVQRVPPADGRRGGCASVYEPLRGAACRLQGRILHARRGARRGAEAAAGALSLTAYLV
jgi:hypothetical protein